MARPLSAAPLRVALPSHTPRPRHTRAHSLTRPGPTIFVLINSLCLEFYPHKCSLLCELSNAFLRIRISYNYSTRLRINCFCLRPLQNTVFSLSATRAIATREEALGRSGQSVPWDREGGRCSMVLTNPPCSSAEFLTPVVDSR